MSTAELSRRHGIPAQLVATTLAGLCVVAPRTGHAETRLTQAPSPQMLPIEARWCLDSSTTHQAPVCIALEVADNHNKRRLGLMHRPPLPPQRGMWFDFQQATPISMWMLNTPSSLDMVFIHRQRVLAIKRHVPPCRAVPCPTYFSDRDGDGNPDLVDWVIELGAGEAERLGLALGDPVTIEPVPTASR